jgi:hypothetical protein
VFQVGQGMNGLGGFAPGQREQSPVDPAERARFCAPKTQRELVVELAHKVRWNLASGQVVWSIKRKTRPEAAFHPRQSISQAQGWACRS